MTARLLGAPVLVHLALLVGLAARLTILVVDDRITHRPRRWLLSKLRPDGYLAYLLRCPWCVGVHASWIVVAAWVRWPGGTLLAAVVGTVALFAALIVTTTDGGAPAPAPHD